MKKSRFGVILLACAVLQAAILPYLKFFTVFPDLLLICCIFAALTFRLKWALFFCLLAGIFKDTFATAGFSLNTFLFPAWAYLVNRLSRKIEIEGELMRLLLVFFVALAQGIISGIILIYIGEGIRFAILVRIFLLSALLDVAIAIPLLRLFKVFSQRINE